MSFALGQAVELYECYRRLIDLCDVEIERVLHKLGQSTPPVDPIPAGDRKARQRKAPRFDLQGALHALLGVDLTQIDGLCPSVSLKLIAECGTDMTRWPTVKHFTSWLTLSPGNKISGGKLLSSRSRRSSSRAAAMLRLAAVTIGRTDTALGAFYRRLGARIGKSKAVTATARKIAVLFYNTLRYGMRYTDPGASYYDERFRQRAVTNLRRRATALGFVLSEDASGPLELGVS